MNVIQNIPILLSLQFSTLTDINSKRKKNKRKYCVFSQRESDVGFNMIIITNANN